MDAFDDHQLPQVSQLVALNILKLAGCKYTSASMACLSTLTTLRRLECTNTHSLPSTLSAMTWLGCLNCGQNRGASAEAAEAWHEIEHAALPRLARLTALVLGCSTNSSNLLSVAQLPRLQRLWYEPDPADPLPDPAALSGPWLASLCWLGLPWGVLERVADALRAAPRLEYLCSLTLPACADEAHWRAAWDFLATHPPLRRFLIEIERESPPTWPFVDALVELRNRRPALVVRRTSYTPVSGFHIELLDEPNIPPVLY